MGFVDTFCYGDSILLAASYQNGYTYQWYAADNRLAGETNDTFFVKNTGLYKVVVESDGCIDSS
jgi:hypothetical protein